ncbi:ankyrin repeat domain-containing protein SOWAHA-like [Mugil cephalus]|uniref:ankyrin repeat domain-containing protein SOWAHA-like n=1 Tax=Mugil cephalus TaxID=48193 RepID=UPI001FB7C087|nr:ankyrin repeat domain-containing protein SOWAHA-like [Mugil cephalus]
MSTECNEETILGFLKERGGKVKNADLAEYFKSVFPEDPPDGRAAAREKFKNCVDAVAFVKSENGVKYVCLKKKFRAPSSGASGVGRERESLEIRSTCSDPVAGCADDAVAAGEPYLSRAAGSRAPGSGYGNDTRGVPHYIASENTFPEKTEQKIKCHEFVCVVDEVDGSSGEMGNRGSFSREGRVSKKEQDGKVIDIPTIAVIEASPLPAEESAFTLPGPAQTGTTGKVDGATPGLDGTGRQAETHTFSAEGPKEAEDLNVTRCQNPEGPQGGFASGQVESDDGEDERQLDACSLSGSEGTPKGSRKHFLELMINSSPQLRRSVALRNSVYLSSRYDSDSSSLDEDRAHVTLDPVEHEWMMCASDGEWGSLRNLLDTEPGLVLKKDFITGFTCLHWAAKHGKPELIALIINFAKQHDIPISVDVRSSAGYTKRIAKKLLNITFYKSTESI